MSPPLQGGFLTPVPPGVNSFQPVDLTVPGSPSCQVHSTFHTGLWKQSHDADTGKVFENLERGKNSSVSASIKSHSAQFQCLQLS